MLCRWKRQKYHRVILRVTGYASILVHKYIYMLPSFCGPLVFIFLTTPCCHRHVHYNTVMVSFFSPPSLGILGLAITCLYFLYQRYHSTLCSVPGPFLASMTDLYRLLDVLTWKCQENQLALHKKYGKYVRYGPNMVAISDPDAIQIIYAINNKFVKV